MGEGYVITKRPGVNKFLLEMGNYYEIVLFGTEENSVRKTS